MSFNRPESKIQRTIDEWGRVKFKSNDAAELLYEGFDIADLNFENDPLVEEYNNWCETFDHPSQTISPIEDMTISPGQEHQHRANTWCYEPALNEINIRNTLLEMCGTDIQRDRVNLEMDLYEERNFVPVLKMLITLTNHWRENKIVFGVGRGSSVASYCLYLLGVHRVDSILYELDIREFLK